MNCDCLINQKLLQLASMFVSFLQPHDLATVDIFHSWISIRIPQAQTKIAHHCCSNNHQFYQQQVPVKREIT